MPGLHLPSENDFDPETDDFFIQCITRERRYLHFDRRLIGTTLSFNFRSDPPPTRFLPLLGFTDKRIRVYTDAVGTLCQKVKERSIRFAGHVDAAYFQAYAQNLSTQYEKAISFDGIAESVLAYRRGGLTNIHYAKSLFDEIDFRCNCTVICLDISGFFDEINHARLKEEIKRLLSVPRLDGHDWCVFRNATRYAWVEVADLDLILGANRRRRGQVCSEEEFREHVRGRSSGLVRTHDLCHGVPQGLPVSGLYANIYMRDFDRRVLSFVEGLGGSYRRYSDDIAMVLPLRTKAAHVIGIVEKLLGDVCLSLSVGKTDVRNFVGAIEASGCPLQYLGFTYDGRRKLIRPSSMDAYRAKMRRGIHAKLVAGKIKGIPSSKVYRREAISRYTHAGKRRNFIRYAYVASEIMGAPEIRQQVKRHMTWFKRCWKREAELVFGGLIEFEW